MRNNTPLQFMFEGRMMDFRTAAQLGCWGRFAEYVRKMLAAKSDAGDELSPAEMEAFAAIKNSFTK
ncbi:MAG: hypothetical protein LBG89_02085 [Rickettsiales bacterium]|jgi:hypothetical protein|nr:hypothetical protein [Rickettsiales bacterium]